MKCNRCGKENPAEIHTCTAPLAIALADEITETPWPETYVSAVAAELRRLHAENEALRQALIDVAYTLEKSRIWSGMDWTYNPLHPVLYLPARDKARAALARAGEVK